MKVNQLVKKVRLTKKESIRMQILIWCGLRHIQITPSVLDMLTLLAINSRMEMASFCDLLSKTEFISGQTHKSFSGKERGPKVVFSSSQSARNTVNKAIEQGLILRYKRHEIGLNPSIEVGIDDNLLVNYQILSIDTNQG